jgi:cellulose biosynthesis protein BcsQ
VTNFDDAIPRLLAVCEGTDGFAEHEACLVRDLAGRLRLAVRPLPHIGRPRLDLRALTAALASALGGYFAGPILSAGGRPARAGLARALFERAQAWPRTWPGSYTTAEGRSLRIDGSRWKALPRRLAKESWLGDPGRPPWPMTQQSPTIVSFHSFKGGVGRSTLLALCARRLARDGRRVTVVDLDFEAPGLAALFDAAPVGGRGALDYVVDHIALAGTGVEAVDLARADGLPEQERGRIGVVPVGLMRWSHIEKLGRLDFAATGQDHRAPSPVGRALADLLELIRRAEGPDFVFLDSRSGLHDLGGLALHALSHVDVLVTRDGPQSLAGLAIVLEALAQRPDGDTPSPIVVHSMAPLESEPGASTILEGFRRSTYELVSEHLYADEDDVPAPGDETAAHWPLPFRFRDELRRIHRAGDYDTVHVDAQDVRAITDRIVELSLFSDLDVEGEGERT